MLQKSQQSNSRLCLLMHAMWIIVFFNQNMGSFPGIILQGDRHI